MKPLVIYHGNCADGFGAAFAAWLSLGDEADYVPMHYMKPGETVAHFIDRLGIDCSIADREVYILDFSLPKPVMDWLFSHAKRVVWLDHHKTAFEMWCGGTPDEGLWHEEDIGIDTDDTKPCWITLDNNKSGALLAWEHFHPGTEVPILFQHIDDHDRWQFKIPGTKEVHAALWSYGPWSFEQWAELNRQLESWDDIIGPHFIFKEGTAILRASNQQVQSMAKHARRCSFDTMEMDGFMGNSGDAVFEKYGSTYLNGLAANAPAHHSSELGHALATQSGTYGLVWYVAEDLTVRCSLRSNGDYDVSAIAKSFGGGGHRNAAGFTTDIDTLMGWLK